MVQNQKIEGPYISQPQMAFNPQMMGGYSMPMEAQYMNQIPMQNPMMLGQMGIPQFQGMNYQMNM